MQRKIEETTLNRLTALHRRLDARVEAEQKRLNPCDASLQALKKERLRAKDAAAVIQSLLQRQGPHSAA